MQNPRLFTRSKLIVKEAPNKEASKQTSQIKKKPKQNNQTKNQQEKNQNKIKKPKQQQ